MGGNVVIFVCVQLLDVDSYPKYMLKFQKSRSPCFLLVSRFLGHFFMFRLLLPLGWRTVLIVRQRRRKMTNTVSSTIDAIQAASNFINAQLYYCGEPRPWASPLTTRGVRASVYEGTSRLTVHTVDPHTVDRSCTPYI
jgi:hypothetical protein